MLDLSLALELSSAGLVWQPAPGDRFSITRTELIDDVFHLADMVVEARHLESGTIFAFNGTTEWALDSVPQTDTVWLPAEHQLRALLGDRFVSLERAEGGYIVTLSDGTTHSDPVSENAYALALLSTLLPRSGGAQ